MYRPIPEAQPEPVVRPAADATQATGRGNITPVDWDDLYHAIQVRLENCVNDALDKAPELPLQVRQAATKTAVLECVGAMRQLHASLILKRQDRQKR